VHTCTAEGPVCAGACERGGERGQRRGRGQELGQQQAVAGASAQRRPACAAGVQQRCSTGLGGGGGRQRAGRHLQVLCGHRGIEVKR